MGDDSAEIVRAAAKLGEPDRYLAALLAPRDVRDDLIAFAALGADLRKIIAETSEAPLGEIRIQFLRDALGDARRGERSGHPIADAAGAALARRSIPDALIDGLFDAHVHRLYADPPADDAALRLELDLTEGALFEMASRTLGGARENGPAISDAAYAYGLARIGFDLPMSLARGRDPLPESWSHSDGATNWKRAIQRLSDESNAALQRCRAALHGCSASAFTAFLPLAVVEPYLAALQGPDFDPAHTIAAIAPLTRVWRIGRAHYAARL